MCCERLLLEKEGNCDMQIHKLTQVGNSDGETFLVSDVVLMFTDWFLDFDFPGFGQLVLRQNSHSFV